MEIDWFIVATIATILVVLISVYYWNQQLNQQEQQASIELQAVANETKHELFNAQYNIALYEQLQFPVIAEYEHTKQHNDRQSNAVKQILMKRTVDVVVKLHMLQSHTQQIVPVIQQGLAPADTTSKIQTAMKRIENEIRSVQIEAALCQPGWENHIIQQAADLSINAQLKKQWESAVQQRKQQEEYNAANNITTPLPPLPEHPPRVQFNMVHPPPTQNGTTPQPSAIPAVTTPSVSATTTPAKPTTPVESVTPEQAEQKANDAFKELMSSDEKQNSPQNNKANTGSSGKKKSGQKSRKG